ncbi:MAG: DUF4125 family protein, partial [Deltaproteobacteria bacterium]
MAAREKLIAKIVELELEMFLTVPADGIYSCQQDPDDFRLHRRAQFSMWSEDTLQSYLEDLCRAKEDGTNLMTIKYALMEDLIPPENRNSRIDEIVTIQCGWQREMVETYPYLMAGARPLSRSDDVNYDTSFEVYLRGELETYSEKTLALLHRDILELKNTGVNGSEKIYEHLVKELG